MELLADDGSSFSCGAAMCSVRPASPDETSSRLFVKINIEGCSDYIEAVVDTGGLYLVLDPDIIEGQELRHVPEIERTQIVIRGRRYSGGLHRVPIQFVADRGRVLDVEVTAFVPELGSGDVWPLPCFLGWHCCLERIRFAVDPVERRFYFGPAT